MPQIERLNNTKKKNMDEKKKRQRLKGREGEGERKAEGYKMIHKKRRNNADRDTVKTGDIPTLTASAKTVVKRN
jgi:hypothetical protein